MPAKVLAVEERLQSGTDQIRGACDAAGPGTVALRRRPSLAMHVIWAKLRNLLNNFFLPGLPKPRNYRPSVPHLPRRKETGEGSLLFRRTMYSTYPKRTNRIERAVGNFRVVEQKRKSRTDRCAPGAPIVEPANVRLSS